jgi:hypothetical protein
MQMGKNEHSNNKMRMKVCKKGRNVCELCQPDKKCDDDDDDDDDEV